MSAELLPCPFCGGGQTEIHENKHWTGMRYLVMSVEVKHWCFRSEGELQSFITLKDKTEEDAITKWNRRKA